MTNTRKLIFLLLLISLLGCNFSEESTTPTTIPDDPPENTPGNGDADTPSVTVSHITIATPQNSVALLQSFSLEVKKHFSDGTDKILTGAWLTANPDTNWYVEQSDTVTINTQGDVTGLKSGSSRVSVNIAGLQSNEIDIEVVDVPPVCGSQIDDTSTTNAQGYCIKVVRGTDFDASGKLFTGSPSIEVMQKLGYHQDDSSENKNRSYSSIITETYISGDFASFRFDGIDWNDDTNSPTFGQDGQYDRYCQDLANMGFLGKNDWRRAVYSELFELVDNQGDINDQYGIAADINYWTKNVNMADKIVSVSLMFGFVNTEDAEEKFYASCVTNE